MSLHRRNPRRDENEGRIIAALEAAGCSVQRLSATGCPDLLVGYHEQMWLAEVKTEDGVLTFDQKVWWLNWQGPSPVLLRSVDDALQLVKFGPAGLHAAGGRT